MLLDISAYYYLITTITILIIIIINAVVTSNITVFKYIKQKVGRNKVKT